MPQSQLPETLLSYLADSEVELISWTGATGELILKVLKEIGPEQGLIRFFGVSQTMLRPRFTICEIQIGSFSDLPDLVQPLSADESIFILNESWGTQLFVVAEHLTYEIIL
ncbi:hypothetical protein [Planctomicrobium piriforme]|uniref:Uncharacterized protein n=1 Tax=Planctomicrobium piriforme TaxID=1576369 RepID=A0A1I3E614_9PLAN|nr:hypothetical protein [Planctomicrobium piriforme]SFH94303.1 hypothetical protein SAMN05421753_10491 [Planctomicrobium piriforme]